MMAYFCDKRESTRSKIFWRAVFFYRGAYMVEIKEKMIVIQC